MYLRNKIKAFNGGCVSSKAQEGKYYSRQRNSETVEGLSLDSEQEHSSQKTKLMSGQASQKVLEEINKLIS